MICGTTLDGFGKVTGFYCVLLGMGWDETYGQNALLYLRVSQILFYFLCPAAWLRLRCRMFSRLSLMFYMFGFILFLEFYFISGEVAGKLLSKLLWKLLGKLLSKLF